MKSYNLWNYGDAKVVKGYPLSIRGGSNFAVVKYDGMWRVLELRSGLFIGASKDTRNTCIYNARQKIDSITPEKLEEVIRKSVDDHGCIANPEGVD